MSEAMNKLNIDVGDVLRKSSNEVGVSDLTKMGLKKVKVIRHSQVNELISKAVDSAINRFLGGGAAGHHEQLKELISLKENAMQDVSSGDRKELHEEITQLKSQLNSQSKTLEEAKQKVIEDSKKEYERLAEKTSLENQLLQQKKVEATLRQQLQEMTVKVGELKEKVNESESKHKEDQYKFQELERLNIIRDELDNLEEENELLRKERDLFEKNLAIEKEKNLLVEKSAGDSSKSITDLQEKVRQSDQSLNELKDQLREKDFAVKEAKMELDLAQKELSSLNSRQSDSSGRENELREQLKVAEGSKQEVAADLERAKSKIETLSEEKAELQKTIEALNGQLASQASANENAALMDAFKNMLGDMKGELSDQISKVKIRTGSGGGGGANFDDVELDPAVVLASLMNTKVESNIGKVKMDDRKPTGKKDLGKALSRLKALKGNKETE